MIMSVDVFEQNDGTITLMIADSNHYGATDIGVFTPDDKTRAWWRNLVNDAYLFDLLMQTAAEDECTQMRRQSDTENMTLIAEYAHNELTVYLDRLGISGRNYFGLDRANN